MPRLVVQADIDTYNAGIIAEGIPRQMVLNDVIVDHSDMLGSGNIFANHAIEGSRLGATIWIKGGYNASGVSYGAIQLGQSFAYTTSSTSFVASDITLGSTVVFAVGSGKVFPVGHQVAARSTVNTGNRMVGSVVSYSGTTLQLGSVSFIENMDEYLTSSSTNINMGTVGSTVTITVGTGKPFEVGERAEMKSTASPTNKITGTVTAYNSATGSLTLGTLTISGSGTYNSWTVNLVISSWEFAVETVRSNSNNMVHIHVFDGRFEMEPNGSRSSDIEFWNMNYLTIDFETNTYPGLRDGWGSGRSGTFGLRTRATFYGQGDMGLKVDSALGTAKEWYIRGCELSLGGFAKLRTSLGVNYFDKIVIERCIMDRSFRGEGMYHGLTTSGPWPVHNNLIVRDNIIAFTAAEALQFQQCADGTDIRNNVIVVADHDYRTPFQGNQDTGSQFDLVQGGVLIRNNIIFHFGRSGMQIFGKDASAQGHPFGSNIPKIINNMWGGGKRQLTARLHSSFTQAAGIIFRDNDITSVNRLYSDVDGHASYHFDMDGTVPVLHIGGTIPDDAYPIHNPSRLTDVTYFNVSRGDVDEPQFVNSGFDNIDLSKITKWHIEYKIGFFFASSATSVNPATLTDGGSVTLTLNTSTGGFEPGNNIFVFSRASRDKHFYATVQSYSGTTLALNNIFDRAGSGASTDWNLGKRIPYTTEDYTWLMEDNSSVTVGFYKCILAHDAHEDRRPDLDATHWEQVWWDVNGKNQYDPLYNGTPYTTNYLESAGDFRLVKGSYHHALGRGLTCNEQSDDYTKYGWQWKQTADGTIRDIPGAYTDSLTIADYSYLTTGRFYRGWVEPKTSSGSFAARVYTEWQTI